jgi:hypothetical protein
VHNRSLFQRRFSQQTIDKLFTLINQIYILLDGKSNYQHVLKLEGQLQAANYYQRRERLRSSLRSETSSSSSSEHSQCQPMKQHYTVKAPSLSTRTINLDYSISQHSQSQYI